MKKILASLMILSVASSAIAATTYTESVVNKWTAPIAKKETQLKQKQEAAVKAQKAKEEAYKKAQSDKKKEIEAKKKADQKKLDSKKKNLDELLKW